MYASLSSGRGRVRKKAPETIPVVEVADVTRKDVPIFAEWVASLDGMVNATIRAQVQGYLVKQNYKEGDVVKKGQILFEIDPRTFKAALEQARGELGKGQGPLDANQGQPEPDQAACRAKSGQPEGP